MTSALRYRLNQDAIRLYKEGWRTTEQLLVNTSGYMVLKNINDQKLCTECIEIAGRLNLLEIYESEEP